LVVRLAYGKKGLDVSLDDRWDVHVVQPRFVSALPNLDRAVKSALANPIGKPALSTWVNAEDTIGIIVNDITRPPLNLTMLHALLEELDFVPKENIKIFIALGSHRPDTEDELLGILGSDLMNAHKIIQNDAFTPKTQVNIGKTSSGNKVWINSELMDCSVKVLTGFIEPHFLAGFSGEGKAVMPGMAGLETILNNHSYQNIAHTNATWGKTVGNPIWEEIREISHMAHADFLINTTLNKNKEVTGIFAGDPDRAHTEGIEHARSTAMVDVGEPFDIVLTTNSGYPLDLNLYQAVKGMSAAAQIVYPGGAIICAAECWDGIPDHGLYKKLLHDATSPEELLNQIKANHPTKQDQWQAQIQAQIQLKASVYLYSDRLTDEQIRNALLLPVSSIEKTLYELIEVYGPDARICVLPEGPQTIPYIG
jgi:lactate racemase